MFNKIPAKKWKRDKITKINLIIGMTKITQEHNKIQKISKITTILNKAKKSSNKQHNKPKYSK